MSCNFKNKIIFIHNKNSCMWRSLFCYLRVYLRLITICFRVFWVASNFMFFQHTMADGFQRAAVFRSKKGFFFASLLFYVHLNSGQEADNVPWLSTSDIAPRGPSPGMLDISHLMGGGQAIGGVIGDGVSAGGAQIRRSVMFWTKKTCLLLNIVVMLRALRPGSYQLQRIMSRCTCQMYYVGYEALIDSEQTDYGHLLPETPADDVKALPPKSKLGGNDLLNNEKPINVLTIVQPELEICTNTVSPTSWNICEICCWLSNCIFARLVVGGQCRKTKDLPQHIHAF